MRIIAPFMVAGILLFASSNQAQTSDEKELRRIEGETARLEQQNDTSLAKFLADDWVCVGPAKSISKTEFIQNVRHNLDAHENGINPYAIEKKNVLVRVFRDTAVVTYIKEYRQTPDTSKGFAEDDTDVFMRDTSGWHLRFTKISPVQTQSASN
jgi:Domain of unknown function (DUF4440)